MVNWISVRSLLSISIIHELPSIPIDVVLAFPKSYLDLDIFVELLLGVGVDENRGECVLKFKDRFMESSKLARIGLSSKTGLERRGYHQYQVDLVYFSEKTQSFELILMIVQKSHTNKIQSYH